MKSLQQINAENNLKTIEAREKGLTPCIAECNGDNAVRRCPFLANYIPEGYKIVNTFFVDSSGFGADNESALSFNQFLGKVKKGLGYGIAEAGEFQVYINEYKRI